MSRRPWSRRIGLVALLFAAAASIHWIEPLRPKSLDERAAGVFTVTTAADSGPGSLRDALFAAARAPGAARIHLAVARIDVESPLPPASQAVAIVIDTDVRTVIDAHALAAGAVLDIEAPRAIVRNVTVERAAGTAFLIHAAGVEISGIAALDSGVGLALVGTTMYLDLRHCSMSRNRIGVQVATAVTGVLQGCAFSQNTESAVWAVQSAGGSAPHTQLKILDNVFTGDRDAVVLANLPVTVERNHFVGSLRNSITVLGSEATLRGNIIRDAVENGVLIDSADHVAVVDNEIGRSPGTGIMVKSSSAVSIEHNKIFGNSYGVVQVFGETGVPITLAHNLIFSQRLDGLLIIGASPVVNDNRSINNTGAGIKVLSVVREGRVSAEAAPHLTGNVTAGNARNDVVRGEYSL
ncbi:MAG: right-handed parallel beta-helix repeat-containing protein [Steroidobacteraceae bacterium]